MFVGDSVDQDVVGGNRLGMTTVLVDGTRYSSDIGALSGEAAMQVFARAQALEFVAGLPGLAQGVIALDVGPGLVGQRQSLRRGDGAAGVAAARAPAGLASRLLAQAGGLVEAGCGHRLLHGDRCVAAAVHPAAVRGAAFGARPVAVAKQCYQRDDAAVSAVVRAQDKYLVFEANDQDQRPDDQRDDAQHFSGGRRMANGLQRLLDCIQRAGADVAEYYAQRKEGEPHLAAAFRILSIALGSSGPGEKT